jgi:hypothetical protein
MRRADADALARVLHFCYLVGNISWMVIFLGYTREEVHAVGTAEHANLVRIAVGDLPGGPVFHLRCPLVLGALCLVNWMYLKLRDPGVVEPSNAQAVCTIEQKVTGAKRSSSAGQCQRCSILERPSRTHHCSTCGNCVYRFDHHCYWLGTCIGANNIVWFTSFLALSAVLYLYGLMFLVGAIVAVHRRACEVTTESSRVSAGILQKDFHRWLFGFHPLLSDQQACTLDVVGMRTILVEGRILLPLAMALAATACLAFVVPKLKEKLVEMLRGETWYEAQHRRAKGVSDVAPCARSYDEQGNIVWWPQRLRHAIALEFPPRQRTRRHLRRGRQHGHVQGAPPASMV